MLAILLLPPFWGIVINSIFPNIIHHNSPPSYHAYTIFISSFQQQRTAYPLSSLW